MITNADYLIQKYAEAVEKINDARGDRDYRHYWNGIRDAYHMLLNEAFEGWAEPGSVGHYVFMEGMTYDAAIGAYQRNLTKEEI